MVCLVKFILSIAVFLALTLVPVFSTGAGGGFSVSPVFPENQNPRNQSVFDLMVEPGSRYYFYVAIIATSDEDAFVEVNITTAVTNSNGVIDYSPRQEGVSHIFGYMVSIPMHYREMRVPGGGTVLLPLTLDVPEGDFHGIKLGAVHFRQVLSEEDIAAAGMIAHRFAHVVPIMISQFDEPVAVEFGLGEVRAELINGVAHIVADILHPNLRVTRDTVIAASIYPQGADVPIFSISNKSADFAPDTVMPLVFRDTGGYGVIAGNYVAVVEIKRADVRWDFEAYFAIQIAEAEAINTEAVNVQNIPIQPLQIEGLFVARSNQDAPAWIPAAVIAAVFLLVLTVVVLVAYCVIKSKGGG